MNAEVIYRNTISDAQNIECNVFPCVINCNAVSSCRDSTISCPTSSNPVSTESVCIINLFNDYSGYQSTINTQQSTHIYINAYGNHSLFNSTINADNNIESTLEIGVLGPSALQYTTIYTPHGKRSKLTIICGDDSNYNTTDGYDCAHMNIYDHFSTTVSLKAHSKYAFFQTEIQRNTLTSSVDHRGSVNLYASAASYGFHNFIYYGTDHGDWTIQSQGYNAFMNAYIYADHSFSTDDSYTIVVNGSTQSNTISNLTLSATQNNAVISLIAMQDYAFSPGFELLCDGDPSFVIDTLTMVAMASHAFEKSVINITNDIRNVSITGIQSNIGGFLGITLLLHVVLNDALFHVDIHDYGLFSYSMIQIQRVGGNIQFITVSGAGHGFFSSEITINDGVGGDVLFVDESNGESFKNSKINILGDIGGNFELYDKSINGSSYHNSSITIAGNINGFATFTAFTGGNSFHSVIFTLNNINGTVQFIDESSHGRAFATSCINIDTVGRDLIFSGTNGGHSFDTSNITIGSINGDLLFVSNTIGTFEQNIINIQSINGSASFIASDNAFNDTFIHIEHGDYIAFEANTSINAFTSSNIIFDDVNIVNISIFNSNNTLNSSIWNCKTCSEFILNCNNEDCRAVDIYCPQNNQRDKCMLQCSDNAVCDDIDIFTTNGYCSDVRLVCDECSLHSTKVYCTINQLHHYGAITPSFCKMIQDSVNNDIWICENNVFGGEESFCVHLCTEEPTFNPTFNPTIAFAATYNPTSVSKKTKSDGVLDLDNLAKTLIIVIFVVCLLIISLSLWFCCMHYKKEYFVAAFKAQNMSDAFEQEQIQHIVELQKQQAKDEVVEADMVTPEDQGVVDDQRKLTEYLIQNVIEDNSPDPSSSSGLPPPPSSFEEASARLRELKQMKNVHFQMNMKDIRKINNMLMEEVVDDIVDKDEEKDGDNGEADTALADVDGKLKDIIMDVMDEVMKDEDDKDDVVDEVVIPIISLKNII